MNFSWDSICAKPGIFACRWYSAGTVRLASVARQAGRRLARIEGTGAGWEVAPVAEAHTLTEPACAGAGLRRRRTCPANMASPPNGRLDSYKTWRAGLMIDSPLEPTPTHYSKQRSQGASADRPRKTKTVSLPVNVENPLRNGTAPRRYGLSRIQTTICIGGMDQSKIRS